jgi:hypothetical protein
MDPRLFQIACLSCFASLGLAFGILPADWLRLGAFFSVSVLTEWFGYRFFRRCQKFTIRSAMITTLSLWILLRVDSYLWICLVPFLAISSKYLFRYVVANSRKHFFNPANFAIVFPILVGAPVWLSPGNWAGYAGVSMWFLALGVLIALKVQKLDTAIWFLATYVGLHFARHLWLGDPSAIFLHKLQNPGLILFTFFMITDPRSTPTGFIGRAAFACTIGCVSFYLSAKHFGTHDFFYVLFFSSLLTPFLDSLANLPAFEWKDTKLINQNTKLVA